MLVLCCAGCESPRPTAALEASPAGPSAIEVVDVLGREVRMARPATRIAALSPGFTETLFAVGCGDRVVLRDRWSDHPAAALRIPQADGVKPSVRHVAGYDPDLVLLYSADREAIAAFDKVGLTAAAFDPRSFDEVVADLAKIGRLCGAGKEADRLAGQMNAVRERIRGEVARAGVEPLAYVEIDGSDPVRPWTAGPGSFVHELLLTAGARNVAQDVSSPYAQVSAEAVIRADPQVILLLDAGHSSAVGSAERIAARPGWAGLRAVREQRVIDGIDRDILSRPGPRLAQGLAALHEALRARGSR
jgi:iron complex transport system substrate-binding protein